MNKYSMKAYGNSYRLLLAAIFVVFVTATSYGQAFNKKNRYTSIGGCLNAMNYIGDLDPGPSFLSPGVKYTRYNIGITMLYRLTPRVSARGTFSYGRIAGDDYKNSSYTDKDIYRKMRNLSFRNQIWEFKVDAVIDLFENRGNYRKRPDYTPYMFVGLAYFHHSPEAKAPNGDYVKLHNLHTEGQGLAGGKDNYSLNQIALPIGIGFRYKLAKHLDLAFEFGWRFTTTDYIDDVGGNYFDKQTLIDNYGQLSADLSDRSVEGYYANPDIQPYADKITGGVPGSAIVYDANGHATLAPFQNADGTPSQRGDKKGRRDIYTIAGFHLTYIIPG